MFGKILNNRLVQCLDKGALHEGQTGFRLNTSYMDNNIMYTLNEIVQGRLKEDKKTYAFVLNIYISGGFRGGSMGAVAPPFSG